MKSSEITNETSTQYPHLARLNEKTDRSITGFIILYALIALGFIAIGPKLFSSNWIGSSDFHSCIEITSSFIAIIAAIACLAYYFGFKKRYYLICGLAFFICGSEDFIHGLFSFVRLFSGIEADLSKFVPGTYVAGRTTFAIFIILAAILGEKHKPAKNVRKETIFFSLIALIVGGGMTALAITLPLPKFIHPTQLISRPVDFFSAILFAIAFVAVLKRFLGDRSIFSGFLLACILLNLGGQVYMSFSKQLFDAFFDTAHWANILSYCMPVIGIAVQTAKEIKTSTKQLIAREQAEQQLRQYQDHLEEIVKERTAQLEAANQQLQAGEQQLKAANQHLLSNEQQLKAGNQQLQTEINQHEQTQKVLKHEKNKVQKYLDVVGVMVIVFDNNQKTRLINHKGCKILGYEEKDILDKDWCSNFVPEQVRDSVRTVLSALLEGKIEQFEYYENPVLTKNGEQRLIAWRNAVLYNEEGQIEAILSSGEDITERKQAEEAENLAYKKLKKANEELKQVQSQMVQSEKLASIGQLAAGVAHEMNTPVGFVASNFQTLESYMKKIRELLKIYNELTTEIETVEKTELLNKANLINKFRDDKKIGFILEDIQDLFDDSREGMERITGIIQNLRDFSRIDQPGSLDEYDLNNGIKATLVVAKNEIKYDADIETDFSETPAIFCNSGQINQVFLNVLINAAQAIKSLKRDKKGTIAIKTYTTDEHVVCEICDDGPGIPPDKLSKVFDPFFTTKPAGKGTGLGLSVSYDIIVHKHNGEIFAESTLGKGSKFTIKLPIKRKDSNDVKEIINDGKEKCFIRG